MSPATQRKLSGDDRYKIIYWFAITMRAAATDHSLRANAAQRHRNYDWREDELNAAVAATKQATQAFEELARRVKDERQLDGRPASS